MSGNETRLRVKQHRIVTLTRGENVVTELTFNGTAQFRMLDAPARVKLRCEVVHLSPDSFFTDGDGTIHFMSSYYDQMFTIEMREVHSAYDGGEVSVQSTQYDGMLEVQR